MALSDIVSLTVSLSSANVTRAGFGVPLILAYDLPAGFAAGTTRSYTSAAAVTLDFPGTGVWKSPTAAAAGKIFAQNPCPPLIKIGGGSLKPTQVFTLTPSAPFTTGTVWSLTVDGQTASYTQGGTATLAAACTGIAAAINALTLSPTATGGASGSSGTHVVFTATNPGDFHAMAVTPAQSVALGLAQTQADPGVGTDLAAINLNDGAWYALCTLFNSALCVAAADTWVEANKKLYVAQTSDTNVVNVSLGSDTSSIAYTLKNSTATRTALLFKQATDDFGDAAWLGAVLPLTAGTETWAFKTLVNVQADALTETQHTNALAKYANTYETIAGINITSNNAVTSGNEYIDVVRMIDNIVANIQEDILSALAGSSKIPMTDQGIAVIQGIILSDLQAFERLLPAAGLVPGSSEVIVPKASAVSSANKIARNLAPVTFSAELAGAIQSTQISGVVTA